MAGGNESFLRRLRLIGDRYEFPQPLVRPGVNPPGGLIVGQTGRGGARQGRGGCSLYTPLGDGSHREYRVGPMLYDSVIEDAFDYYMQGLKFAAQKCSYPPYPVLGSLQLEQIWIAGMIASTGQCDRVPGPAETKTMMAGNVFVVGLPDSMLYDEAEANRLVLSGARIYLAGAPDDVHASINARFDNPPWNVPGAYDTLPANCIYQVIDCSALLLSAQGRLSMMSTYVAVFLAYTQQGNITARKLQKISAELTQGGLAVTLTADEISDLWTKFGTFFDEGAAKDFFPRWATIMEQRSLRLRLTFLQAANAGLTGLTLIRNIILACPDFFWDRLAARFQAAWGAFVAAHRLVGDNIWYGFKKDLGVVSVRNYAPIVYCAKQLQSRVLGDQNMGALQTVSTMQIPDTPFIDRLVADYVNVCANRRDGGDMDAALAYFEDPDDAPANFAQAAQAPPANDAINALLDQLRAAGVVPQ